MNINQSINQKTNIFVMNRTSPFATFINNGESVHSMAVHDHHSDILPPSNMSQTYVVEKILAKRKTYYKLGRRPERYNEYLLKWKDYPMSDSTWELESNCLEAKSLVDNFNEWLENKLENLQSSNEVDKEFFLPKEDRRLNLLSSIEECSQTPRDSSEKTTEDTNDEPVIVFEKIVVSRKDQNR